MAQSQPNLLAEAPVRYDGEDVMEGSVMEDNAYNVSNEAHEEMAGDDGEQSGESTNTQLCKSNRLCFRRMKLTPSDFQSPVPRPVFYLNFTSTCPTFDNRLSRD